MFTLQYKKAKTGSNSNKKKLEILLKRKKQLMIIDKGIKELDNLDEPIFKRRCLDY